MLVFVVNKITLGKARRVVRNGKEWLVAPVTSLVEGVLNGSKGSLFYPAPEIRATYRAWDGIPLTCNHPSDPLSGSPLSANDTGVLDRQGLGRLVKSTVVDGNRQQHEAWFDRAKTLQVNGEIVNRLERGEPIEVSTGLFTDNEAAPSGATFNGRPYDYIARRYKPDHLAILPDQRGACSREDGCGVLVNAESQALEVVGVHEQPFWVTTNLGGGKGDCSGDT